MSGLGRDNGLMSTPSDNPSLEKCLINVNLEAANLPSGVHMAFTTRKCGRSRAPFDSFNLGLHVGDDPKHVDENRKRLLTDLSGVERIAWLNQIHSTDVVTVDDGYGKAQDADAAVTRSRGIALAIMTADCLPVLLASDDGSVVGAAHCGWRGLAGGVLENTVRKMNTDPGKITAWLGPCIGPEAFEVGEIVRESFCSGNPDGDRYFRVSPPKNGEIKYLADLPGLARQKLRQMGVVRVISSGLCTYSDSSRFFSYRREHVTGRMASLVWIG